MPPGESRREARRVLPSPQNKVLAASSAALPIWPVWLWAGFLAGAAASAPAVFAPVGFSRLLQPLTVFHPEWVGNRIEKVTAALSRFASRVVKT